MTGTMTHRSQTAPAEGSAPQAGPNQDKPSRHWLSSRWFARIGTAAIVLGGVGSLFVHEKAVDAAAEARTAIAVRLANAHFYNILGVTTDKQGEPAVVFTTNLHSKHAETFEFAFVEEPHHGFELKDALDQSTTGTVEGKPVIMRSPAQEGSDLKDLQARS
jgi:hypothetical protein